MFSLLLGVAGKLRSDGAGLDFHHANAKRRQLQAQRGVQRVHGRLGRAISTGEWRHQHARDATDVNDQAAITPQQREQRASDPNQGEHVGFELLAQPIDTAIEHRAHGAVAGIVDEDIEAAMAGLQLICEACQLGTVIDVQLSRGKARCSQLGNGFGLARGGPDLMTGITKGIGKGAADAAGATGNQDCGHGGACGLCKVLDHTPDKSACG
ncbi:hypothetical protein PS623_01144 [Pseudomonas fluorescens]|nr:hypothetical protein PS623_01144 [Pseudomonas fluorescens]